jgi:hypothetical protein
VGLVKKLLLFLALLADLIWLYLPGALFFFAAGSWSSFNGALGEASGFFLTVIITVALTSLWGPYSFRVSRPLLGKLAKRLGFKPPPGKD